MKDSLQDILFQGEQVLWSGKPDKFCYMWRSCAKLLPIAIIWLLFDGFFIITMITSGAAREMWWFLIIFFGIHLLPVWSLVGNIIKSGLEYKNIIYAVTDRRVILRNGVVGLDFENINYTDISNIRADVSIIEKIRNVGSVFVTTSSSATICLVAIPEPYKVYKDINKIFMDVKSDIEYPNAYRPSNNPGYNTKYDK